jgi:sialic acid synthase SpsE
MSKTFIIAEAACTWLHGGLEAAYRSIRAAKECGADAWKTQWTSNAHYMAKARWDRMQLEARFQTVEQMAEKYQRLAFYGTYLLRMREECERVGIEFMVTVFLPEDVEFISDLVKRFKVSAFESKDREFVQPMLEDGREIIVSANPGALRWGGDRVKLLHCISEYPTPLERLRLSMLGEVRPASDGSMVKVYSGLSDHTTSTEVGGWAVATGATHLEKHVRLHDTPEGDPDYGHSLVCDWVPGYYDPSSITPPSHNGFGVYTHHIRDVETAL